MAIYDSTLFKDKPAAGTLMGSINRVGSAQIDVGDYSGVKTSGPVYMDAEFYDDVQMVEAKKAIQRVHPGSRIGTYAVYPKRDYWRAIEGPESIKYSKWLSENRLRMEGGNQMDIIMPSLYTFYPDQAGWLNHAKANLVEAMKYDKEIFPFLWFDYHDASATPDVYIGDDYWRMQIQTCLDLTGNAVIWGGWDLSEGTGALPWDDNATWYKVVQEFL